MNIINDYMGGQYELIKSYEHPDYLYDDGTYGNVIMFDINDLTQ